MVAGSSIVSHTYNFREFRILGHMQYIIKTYTDTTFRFWILLLATSGKKYMMIY